MILTKSCLSVPDLYILRHGNTFDRGDVVTRVGGRTDLPLSSSGQAQALAVAQHFADQGLTFRRIFSAPLKRTLMTAETIRDQTAPGITIEALEGLREVDYGPDENLPEEEVIARIGDEALALWESDAVPPPEWLVNPDALRVTWRQLFDTLSFVDGPILAVTSNGVARFALDAADSVLCATERKLKTGAYGVVSLTPQKKATITAWNVRG